MRASAWFGFCTAPPWRPECRSDAGPVTSMSSAEQALGRDRHRRLARPPHRAVGRHDEVGAQLVRVRAQERRQRRAADLLLALDQELDGERRRPRESRGPSPGPRTPGPCRRSRRGRRCARRAPAARTAASSTRRGRPAAARRSGRRRGSSARPAGRPARPARPGGPRPRPRARPAAAPPPTRPPPASAAPPSSDTLGMARNAASSASCSEEGTATVDRDHLAGQPRRPARGRRRRRRCPPAGRAGAARSARARAA